MPDFDVLEVLSPPARQALNCYDGVGGGGGGGFGGRQELKFFQIPSSVSKRYIISTSSTRRILQQTLF